MAFQIINADEPLPPKNLLVVIYGEPGMAKTSLAFTAADSMLLDFDKGVERAVGRTTTVKFTSWYDVIEFMEQGILEQKKILTAIIDTGGNMLDNFIGDYVMQENKQNIKKGGGLSMQGYGAMQDVFKAFKNRCQALGIDIVMVCHQKKDSDSNKYVPKMTGGSFDVMISEADLVGYMYSENDKITLDFNKRDSHYGKNSPEFPTFILPHYSSDNWPTYLADLMQKTKDKMMEQNASQEAALAMVDKHRKDIKKCKDVPELDVYLATYLAVEMSKTYKVQIWKMFTEKYLQVWGQPLDEAQKAEHLNNLIADANERPPAVQKLVKMAILEKGKTLPVVLDAKKGIYSDKPAAT